MNKTEKLLKRFEFSWQLPPIKAALEQNQISYNTYFRPREYTGILLGGSNDQVDLFVDVSDFGRAQVLLAEIEKSVIFNETQESSKIPEAQKNYFRRVIVLTLLSFVFLPLVFNFFATVNYVHFRKQKHSTMKRLFTLFFLVLGWVGAVAILVYFFSG